MIRLPPIPYNNGRPLSFIFSALSAIIASYIYTLMEIWPNPSFTLQSILERRPRLISATFRHPAVIRCRRGTFYRAFALEIEIGDSSKGRKI